MTQPDQAYQGVADHGDFASYERALFFTIKQMIGKIATTAVVRVVAVRPGSPIGSVDVSIVTGQLDGYGNVVPHGIINNVPYFRLQGGSNAVIMDPQVGDRGVAVFASTDISSFKKTRAPGPPGSRRRYDPADAIYFGGILNDTPTRTIEFTDSGVTIRPAGTLTILGDVEIEGAMHVSGDVSADADLTVAGKTTTADLAATGTVDVADATISGSMTAGDITSSGTISAAVDVLAAGKSGVSHRHGGVSTGSGTSGPPA